MLKMLFLVKMEQNSKANILNVSFHEVQKVLVHNHRMVGQVVREAMVVVVVVVVVAIDTVEEVEVS